MPVLIKNLPAKTRHWLGSHRYDVNRSIDEPQTIHYSFMDFLQSGFASEFGPIHLEAPIIFAFERCELEHARNLIKAGAEINQYKDKLFNIALHRPFHSEQMNLFKLLFENDIAMPAGFINDAKKKLSSSFEANCFKQLSSIPVVGWLFSECLESTSKEESANSRLLKFIEEYHQKPGEDMLLQRLTPSMTVL